MMLLVILAAAIGFLVAGFTGAAWGVLIGVGAFVALWVVVLAVIEGGSATPASPPPPPLPPPAPFSRRQWWGIVGSIIGTMLAIGTFAATVFPGEWLAAFVGGGIFGVFPALIVVAIVADWLDKRNRREREPQSGSHTARVRESRGEP